MVSAAFGWEDPGAAFTAVTQLGTVAAVVIYFRRDIVRIISVWARSLFKPELRGDISAREGWYVIVGTIPIVVLGLAVLAPDRDRGPRPAAGRRHDDRRRPRAGRRGPVRRAGRARCRTSPCATASCSAWPRPAPSSPASRARASTISAGLFLGYTREAATRYSFLLSIPAVLLSGLYEATKIGEPGQSVQWPQTLVATVIAFVVGYAVIAWLLRYVSNHSFMPFVVYRVGARACSSW